jgi:predicted DNA-binding transcriptional regulator AlpA
MALTHPLPAVAQMLGLKESYLRAKVRNKEVPFTRIGKVSVGFTDEQIQGVLEALAVQPQPKQPESLTTGRSRSRGRVA